MIQWILNLIFLFCFFGCTPTNEGLTELVGGEATKTKTVPSDLGNQAFQFTPESYDFGNRAVNSAPTTTSVTIKNISTHTVYVSNISGPTGTFSLVSDNCPRSPSAMVTNQSCTAVLSFAPNIGGILNSSLVMTYGASVAVNSAYTASMGLSGTGVGTLAFNGIDTVSDIYSTQLKLNWTHVAGTLVYYIFKVNADNSLTLVANVTPPTATYIVSGLTASTSYKYWVRAMDTVGAFDSNTNKVSTATNTTPPAPVLTGYSNYTFASGTAITLGSTLSLDLEDIRTGVTTDAGVTYSCSFDQVVNGSVTSSGNCGNLIGTFAFSTTNGALSWTVTTQGAIGFYEFKMLVTDNGSSLTNAAIFAVDIKPTYSTTNLIGNYSAMFSNGISTQSANTSWQDLTTNNFDGTVTNVAFNGLYDWLGSGTVASPYRLALDGVNDYVDFGLQGSSELSLTFETWYKPTLINTSPLGYIVSNGDSGNKGLTLREARGYRNRLEGFVGNKSYADEILADSPLIYLRMGEISGDTPYDIGSGGFSWVLSGVSSYEMTSPLSGNDKAMGMNGSGYGYYTGNVVNPSTWAGLTFECWSKIDVVNTYPTFFAHDTQQAARTFFWFFMNGANSLYLQYVGDGAVRSEAVAFTPVLGTWYHYAFTVDFTSKVIKLYVNGVNVLNSTVPFATILHSNDNAQEKVGTYSPGTATHSINGGMDESAVYNYALSDARILAHYNAKNNYFDLLSNRIDNNVFNHLALTYDDPSTSLALYTNSGLDAATSTSAVVLNGTTANMAVGAKLPTVGSPSANTFSAGILTDVRIYNSSLSGTSVKANMATQLEQFDIPKSPSGLVMWFDASDLSTLYTTTDCSTTPVTTNGQAVACWKDKSGLNNHATQGTPAQKPIYKSTNATLNNKPSLTFGGSGVYSIMTTPSQTVGVRTYFVVMKTNGAPIGSYHRLILQSSAPYYNLISNGGNASYYINAFYDSATTYTGSQLHTLIHNASAFYYRINQTQVLTAAVGAADLTASFSLGGWPNPDGLNGEMLEVIVYNRALAYSEVYRIEGYLKAKYNL